MLKNSYYKLKPFIPRRLQVTLRRILIGFKKNKYKDFWPIYHKASRAPVGWTGWPNNKQFAFVLTHDVDARRGEDRCLNLMNLEKELEFISTTIYLNGKY